MNSKTVYQIATEAKKDGMDKAQAYKLLHTTAVCSILEEDAVSYMALHEMIIKIINRVLGEIYV